MNKLTRTTLLLVLVLFLAACGGSAPAPQAATTAVAAVEEAQQEAATAPEATVAVQDEAQSAVQPEAPVLAQDFENAVSVQMQLLAGTFLLEGSPLAVTAIQAEQLIPLWQMIKALTGTGTSAQAEVDAVLDQIQLNMTAEQNSSHPRDADHQRRLPGADAGVGHLRGAEWGNSRIGRRAGGEPDR